MSLGRHAVRYRHSQHPRAKPAIGPPPKALASHYEKPGCDRSDRARRWIAPTATELGDPHDRAWPGDGGDRRGDRQRRLAHHRRIAQRQSGIFDLDRQRLPARDHDLAAAVGVARGNYRLPSRLSGRAAAVHAGIAVLRAGAYAASADGGAHFPGIWRRGHPERQCGTGSLHLSARPARARHRRQRAGGRDLSRGRSHRRRGDSGCRHLALSVRHQRAARHRHAGAGLAHAAAHATRRAPVRLAKRRAQRRHVRARHRRDRQRRSWRNTAALPVASSRLRRPLAFCW